MSDKVLEKIKYLQDRNRKRIFFAYNFITGICYCFLLIIFIVCMCAYRLPSNLKSYTGTISKIRNYDYRNPSFIERVLSFNSSLEIFFTDKSRYEATGVFYNNIDDKLFDLISVGDEITIIYNETNLAIKSFRIYGIEYKGAVYLNTEDVLTEIKSSRKTAFIVCPILIAVSTVAATVCFIINYKKNKPNKEII